MFLDIERAAWLTISETDVGGLRVVSWRPFSVECAPNAASSRSLLKSERARSALTAPSFPHHAHITRVCAWKLC
jgi:hypothetical protein